MVKFILDVHLGKLAKYLRLLGFDSLYKNSYEDKEIVITAAQENRVILTRDRGILMQKAVKNGYYVTSDDPVEQVKEVVRHFDLYKEAAPFTICLKCNGSVVSGEPEEVKEEAERLGAHIHESFDSFTRCKGCGRVYWKGTHFERLKRFAENILEKS